MKKIKLLTPVLTVATLASVAPIITLATSCNKNNSTQDEIELDSSTAKEQTTNPNKTVVYYEFNTKKTKVSNEDEQEIEAEVTDVETKDEVSVEISALKYDPTTGKCYVTVTISKEDGTLNDAESVSFSLNFHGLDKHSRKEKWAKKIDKFIIKHSTSQIWSGHFDDTDTDKKFKTTSTESSTATFTFTATDTWSSTPTEEQYDISKIKCFLLPNRDFAQIFSSIELPDFSEPLEDVKIKEPLVEGGNQTLVVSVPYSFKDFVHYGDKARFSLLFTYGDDLTVFQTIGGFSIQYVQTLEEPHVLLAGSREQHYYTPKATSTETASNSIGFLLDEQYNADDLTVTSNDERLVLGQKYVYSYKVSEEITLYYLMVNYSLNLTGSYEHNLYNVKLTIANGETWKQEIRGLSFFTIGRDWAADTLISADSETLQAIAWKPEQTSMEFNDVLRVCYPFDISDFVAHYEYAIIDDAETPTPFTITQLGYSWEQQHYSVATLNTTGIDAGEHSVKFYVYVITEQVAYYYCLDAGKVQFIA